MTRNFTKAEATAFLSDSFHTHPDECRDNGVSLEFSEVGLDRDDFELKLKLYAFDTQIPMDLDAFTYSENETDVLTVQIPYTGAE